MRLRLLVAGNFVAAVAIGVGAAPLPCALAMWACGIAASVAKRDLIARGAL